MNEQNAEPIGAMLTVPTGRNVVMTVFTARQHSEIFNTFFNN